MRARRPTAGSTTRNTLVVLAASWALAAPVAAAAPPAPWSVQPPPVAAKPEPTRRSPGVATILALGGTLSSVGILILSGTTLDREVIYLGLGTAVVLPSLGHWYSNKPFTLGLGLRAASSTAAIIGLANEKGCGAGCDDGVYNALIYGGLIGLGLGAAYDIATAGHWAERYNERHGLGLTMAPTLLPTRAGTGYGVALGGAF
jgi:hypothetical protein